MSLDPIGSIADLASSIISRIWPNPEDAAKAKLAALEIEAKLQEAQISVDQAEAANPSIWVSGWRPCIGWVCAASFAWQFVVLPILSFIAVIFHHPIQVPAFDFNTMSTVLMGMLGLGAMRTVEKVNKVQNLH